MDHLARWLSFQFLLIAAPLLAYGCRAGYHKFGEMLMAVVGLAVAAIPGDLSTIMTIALAIGVQTMAQRHAVVQRLPAIEAIGNSTIADAIPDRLTDTAHRIKLTRESMRKQRSVNRRGNMTAKLCR